MSIEKCDVRCAIVMSELFDDAPSFSLSNSFHNLLNASLDLPLLRSYQPGRSDSSSRSLACVVAIRTFLYSFVKFLQQFLLRQRLSNGRKVLQIDDNFISLFLRLLQRLMKFMTKRSNNR